MLKCDVNTVFYLIEKYVLHELQRKKCSNSENK